MVISLTFKEILRRIKFPVYALPSEDFYLRDGLLLLDELVVDDKNQSGDTIGKRRLQTPHKLKKLSKTYETFLDLIKENPPYLIDNEGNPFSYEKTKFATLISRKIKKKELKDTHTIVWVSEVNFPFAISRPPLGKEWAQILYIDEHPWLLYSFSENREPNAKRKI